MTTKKVLTGAVLGLALLILTGCGNNPASTPSNATPQTPEVNSPTTPPSATNDSASLPVPTGKVDDTVNAIVDGANEEGMQVTSDENDARSITTDNLSVGDLGASL
jgi:ABC-type oligopeptide transport system substrate-binding subunit